MEFFKKVDAKLIGFFTKISHRFQRLTGRTNFFLAKIALCVVGLSLMSQVADYFLSLFGIGTSALSVVLALGAATVVISWAYECDEAKHGVYAEEKAKRNFMPPEADPVCIRIIFLALLVPWITVFLAVVVSPNGILAFKILLSLYAPALVTFLYFIAVDPLPPGKSKIRECGLKLLPQGFAG